MLFGDLSQAVDLEVIKQQSNVPSETMESCDDFRRDLLEHDIQSLKKLSTCLLLSKRSVHNSANSKVFK